jgi:hypothetical protein
MSKLLQMPFISLDISQLSLSIIQYHGYHLSTNYITAVTYLSSHIMAVAYQLGNTTIQSLHCYIHRLSSTLAFMSTVSDIDIPYFYIWTKYVGLNPLISIPEQFRYRHQHSFRYRNKSISDIPISKIDKPFPNDPSKIPWDIIFLTGFELSLHVKYLACFTTVLRVFTNFHVGYHILGKSLFLYPI